MVNKDKKEAIIQRSSQILVKHLNDTGGMRRIKELVCNKTNTNTKLRSKQIFEIIFSSDSVNVLFENMNLTTTAKNAVKLIKAGDNISSFFHRRTTKKTRKTGQSQANTRTDAIMRQIDAQVQADSNIIIERALLTTLTHKCAVNEPEFSINVQASCIEPLLINIIQDNYVDYFNGGGGYGCDCGSNSYTMSKSKSKSKKKRIRKCTRVNVRRGR